MLLPQCQRLFRKVLAAEFSFSTRAAERFDGKRKRLEVQSLETRMLLAGDFCVSPDLGDSQLEAPLGGDFAPINWGVKQDSGASQLLGGAQPAGADDDHGDDSANATPISDPSDTAGVIGVVEDTDWFRFDAVVGRLYVMETTLTGLADSTLTLYAPDGVTVLEFDDDSGVGPLASKISWSAPASATYFIKVDNFSDQTGGYRLALSSTSSSGDEHGNDAASATHVAARSDTNGVINTTDDVDWFSFDALLGNEYTVETALGTLVDSTLTIYDTDGTTELAFNDDITGTNFASRIVWTAPASGRYFIKVDNLRTETGSYTLSLIPSEAEIVGRHIFYDGSSFDGDGGVHSANDDAALDPSKTALFENQQATFANYTGFIDGITGIFVDIKNLSTTPTADDFEFRVGNSTDPSTWPVLSTPPTIDVRPGEGVDNSSRVSLIWPAGTIANQWLRVKVLAAGPNRIVLNDDVHYWGNQRGDTGNNPTRTVVNASDRVAISANYSGTTFVGPDSPYDVNKNRRVNAGDKVAVSFNYSGTNPTLLLFTPPAEFDVFNLSSKPDSNFTLYIDFDGHVTTGTTWNTQYGVTSIVSPGFDLDGDINSFSELERDRIFAAWQEVAEDFAPFDINVTTRQPPLGDLMNTGGTDTRWGARAVVTDDTFANCGCGGHAYLNSFDDPVDIPTFVYNQGLGSLGKTVSHEVGHMLGLRHDGDTAREYYSSHGTGATRWGPLMGAPFSTPVTQWNNGDYFDASRQEDDLEIITTINGFGYRDDDYGNTRATSTQIPVSSSNSIEAFGIIERTTDVDYFRLDLGAGAIDIAVDPITSNANLDVFAALYNAAGDLVFVSNPANALSAAISTTVTAGTYFLRVEGVGSNDVYNATTDTVSAPATKPWQVANPTGYSDYGSLGQFKVSGSVPASSAPQGAPLDGADLASGLKMPHPHSQRVFSNFRLWEEHQDPDPLPFIHEDHDHEHHDELVGIPADEHALLAAKKIENELSNSSDAANGILAEDTTTKLIPSFDNDSSAYASEVDRLLAVNTISQSESEDSADGIFGSQFGDLTDNELS